MMRTRSFWVIIALLAIALLMIGCEGKEGKIGPAGPAGSQGSGAVLTTYVGNNANYCGTCHYGPRTSWETAAHSTSYDDLSAADKANPYCLQCHTTGFDTRLNAGDTISATNRGADRFGFDDALYTNNTERMAALKNVQCEACHGAYGNVALGTQHNERVNVDDRRYPDGSTNSLCNRCHGTLQGAEWQRSIHGTVFDSAVVEGPWNPVSFAIEWQNATSTTWNTFKSLSNCWECHTAEGFIHLNDRTNPLFAEPSQEAHMIGCATCHDPHGNPRNDYQLRNLSNDTTVYYAAASHPVRKVVSGYGTSQLCVQCHHDRRDSASVTSQINNGTSRFGSHGSPQMDQWIGYGSYEIADTSLNGGAVSVALTGVLPYNSNRTHPHNTSADAVGRKGCVMCHMPIVGTDTMKHGDHSFHADIAACNGCHPGRANFRAITGSLGADMNAIDTLAAQVRRLIPIVNDDSLGNAGSGSTKKIRKAAWAYKFWMMDGSHGAHNPAYTKALLTNAKLYLQSTNP